jgi:hypothetical protein
MWTYMYLALSTGRSKEWKWNLGAHFIKVTPSLQQSLQWKTTCIGVVIKVSILNKKFVPMTNHLLKDPKWLINIHYFVDLMNINTTMKNISSTGVPTYLTLSTNRSMEWKWYLGAPFYRGNSKSTTIPAMKKTCMTAIIKVLVLNENFVPMTNHLSKIQTDW